MLCRSTGLDSPAAATPVAEAVARAGLVPEAAHIAASWILALLLPGTGSPAKPAWTAKSATASAALPLLDPGNCVRPSSAHPRCSSHTTSQHRSAHYPDVLNGRINGEQALFGEAGIIPWVKYFSKTTDVRHHNRSGRSRRPRRRQRTPKRSWKSAEGSAAALWVVRPFRKYRPHGTDRLLHPDRNLAAVPEARTAQSGGTKSGLRNALRGA